MRLTLLYFILLSLLHDTSAKKKPSEFTQKDWDRIAREWEREEMEEDEKEREEMYKKSKTGLKFDPNGQLNPESLMAQAKRGKPTMVFLTIKSDYCKSQADLTKYTQDWSRMLLNGNIPVQTFPVAENRAIFMVQEGSLSFQIKDFLLKQKEIESVSIDQQEWRHDGGGKPNFPGQKPSESDPKKEKKKEKKAPNDTEKKDKPKTSDHEVHNTLNPEDKLADKEIQDKFFKGAEAKSPKPSSENNKIKVKQNTVSENDVKSEL